MLSNFLLETFLNLMCDPTRKSIRGLSSFILPWGSFLSPSVSYIELPNEAQGMDDVNGFEIIRKNTPLQSVLRYIRATYLSHSKPHVKYRQTTQKLLHDARN